MAVTESNHTVSNSSTTNYSFTFPYLKTTDVKVSINGTASSAWTFHNATTVKLNSNPTVGDKIRIYRETDDSDLQATFYAGSSIKASDLNDNFTQTLYVSQESNNKIDTAWTSGDETIDSSETWVSNDLRVGTTQAIDGRIDSKIDTALTGDVVAGNRITVTDNSPSSGKITVAVTSGSLVDSDVNASAGIAGTKVSPNFGSQNVSTSGTLGAGNTTVSGNIVVTGTVDGRDVAADGTKLDGIDTGAKDDQTAAEIKTLIASSPLDSSHLATNSVDSVKLANNSVDTAALQDLNVTTAKIANDAVTRDKIATSAIGTNEIDSGSITSTLLATDSVTTNHIADAELTTLAGMQSGTASKLAASTALTADIADLNQINGLTKQTTISDSDASFPTSGAVVDYVAAQISPLGGLEVISNEDNFPATQPASGVVISIADAGGIVVNGSGVSTTARTAGNGSDNVTINGFPSTLYSTTLVDNMGLLVSSTGSSNTYTYHKLLGKEDDIKQLSSDINDFKARYRVGSSNPTSDNDAGDLFFNTATDKLLVRNAANNAWEEAQSVGNFYISTLSPAFDGSTTEFTITNAPTYASQVLLIINGVLQKPNAGTSAPADGFAIDGSTIKLGGAPATGSTYSAVVIGTTVNIGTPNDNTVSTAKIQNLAVTTDKIAADAVTAAKIADDAVGAEHIEVLDANLQLADSVKIQVGTGNDLELYHDGDSSYINHVTSGTDLVIDAKSPGDDLILRAADDVEIRVQGNENAIKCIGDGAVELYNNGNKKLETNSSGITITGNSYVTGNDDHPDNSKARFGTSNDLNIFHDGTDSKIETTTGKLDLKSTSSHVNIKANNSFSVWCEADGMTALYWDGNRKFETSSDGTTTTGNATFAGTVAPSATDTYSLGYSSQRWENIYMNNDMFIKDNGRICFGDSNDFQLHHDGSHSYISDAGTGFLIIKGSEVQIQSDGGEDMAKFEGNGSVSLFHNNTLSLATKAYGINLQSDSTSVYIKFKTSEGSTRGYVYANNADNIGFVNPSGSWSFRVESDGDYQLYGSSISDRDRKDNITTVTGTSLDKITKLVPKTYKWKNLDGITPTDKTFTGFIAQEIKEHLPSLVTGTDGQKNMAVDYNGILAHAVKAITELSAEVETLKTKVAALEAK